jgi:DNA-binding CsgD family transcriptional regulator
MAGPTKQERLFPDVSDDEHVVVVNDRCMVRTQDGLRIVLAASVPLAQYAVGDRMAEAHAMVSLVEQGWADQNDIARAFGCTPRTVRRHQRRFESGGLAALGRRGGFPQGRGRSTPARVRVVSRLKAEGHSNRAIAARIGVTEKAVRKLLRRLGWTKPATTTVAQLPLAAQPADPNLSAFPSDGADVRGTESTDVSASAAAAVVSPAATMPCPGGDPNLSAISIADDEVPPWSADTDPADRRFDRLLAYLGLLDDAAPIFRPGTRVPGAGVLLALPAILTTGLLTCAKQTYGSIGPAFYGLRTTFVTLVLMALLRIKRPEGLKERSPQDLGRVLGLDRAPEVKTVRRKLARLASFGRAAQLGHALAVQRVAARGAAMGFLYADGHVRVYHGQRAIPKAHVARMRISLPATTDYWINDDVGDPLFVVTAEANAGLVKMLPVILAEVRGLLGPRRLTVVFDRGGWSPKLFQQIIAADFDILTYRKGRFPRVPRGRFADHAAVFEGRKVRYRLAEQTILLLGRKLRLRQVTRLSENGHQTPIVTSRRDLQPIAIAYRMFERWRQENFFKYLREEYALDALADYSVQPDDPTRDVPNPRRLELDAELRKARAELRHIQADLGVEALVNAEHIRRTMRGFKIANASLSRQVWSAFRRCLQLERKRAATPSRVPVTQVVGAEVVKLSTERKHLTNLVKMVAYQAESDLARQLVPHYRRADDEGRTLIQSALDSPADIHVTDHDLRITLVPLSSPHRSLALATLCDELNRTAVRFPGTRLVLRYAVAPGPWTDKADKTQPL